MQNYRDEIHITNWPIFNKYMMEDLWEKVKIFKYLSGL